jgi:transcriptional regulator with XRE-family HTH domain
MENTNKEKFKVNRIKVLRESLGYSQDYVASQLNITQQALSRIEQNPENATLNRLKELSLILGVSLTSLIGEEDTYILQNFQQQGGQASTVMYMTGIAENERKAYENHIKDLKEQLVLLSDLLKKTIIITTNTCKKYEMRLIIIPTSISSNYSYINDIKIKAIIIAANDME